MPPHLRSPHEHDLRYPREHDLRSPREHDLPSQRDLRLAAREPGEGSSDDLDESADQRLKAAKLLSTNRYD